MGMVTLLYTRLWVPAVVLYLAEELIVLHHTGAAGLVMVQVYKPAVAEFLAPARQVFGNYMGMYINPHVAKVIPCLSHLQNKTRAAAYCL